MRKLLLIAGFLALNVSVFAQTKWTLDPAHSEIKFVADYMVFTEVTGEFEKYEAEIVSSGEDFSGSEITFTAEVNSINTGIEKRDNHLKSPDFFDAENHPKLTFKGKAFKKLSGDQYKLVGDLTIRGTTKEVELGVVYKGKAKDPWGNTKVGFKVEGTINRYDFGLKWNKALETGGLLVSEEIDLVCNVTLVEKGN